MLGSHARSQIVQRSVGPGFVNKLPWKVQRMLSVSAISKSDSPYIDPNFELQGASNGPLSGLNFAVKDMYAVKGVTAGFGNPTWLSTHEPAGQTCPTVQALLDAGASIKGRTHMDELAYSLNGENHHYGTPKNPAAPSRIPGGSSSGSASAVSAGDVDFALGSDTGGSVRIPASYTGILGIRTTHARVSLEGVPPLGASFDTCGWFSRDPEVFRRVGSVILPKASRKNPKIKRWLVCSDAFALADQAVQNAIFKVVKSKRADFDANLGQLHEIELASSKSQLGDLGQWFQVFRVIQGAEAWRDLGEWITKDKPSFGPGIKERFEAASKITHDEWDKALKKQESIIKHTYDLIKEDAVLVIPTSPGPAPLLGLSQGELNHFRSRLLSLTSIAGICRLPQVSIPCGLVDDAPIGLSFIGPQGSDEALLEITQNLYPLVS